MKLREVRDPLDFGVPESWWAVVKESHDVPVLALFRTRADAVDWIGRQSVGFTTRVIQVAWAYED